MTGNIGVVVIGGGYAGVMTANRLTQRDDVAVTLINPRSTFVERIRLHQLVGGSDDAVVDFQEILAGGVRLMVDTATRIDAAGRSVTLATGGTVGYDYLIYAVGSGSADPRVPGAAEFAYPIASLEEAQRLRSVVDDAPATALVTVVGGGPLGIETAAELAELGRSVTLVCGEQLGPYLHPRGRRSVAATPDGVRRLFKGKRDALYDDRACARSGRCSALLNEGGERRGRQRTYRRSTATSCLDGAWRERDGAWRSRGLSRPVPGNRGGGGLVVLVVAHEPLDGAAGLHRVQRDGPDLPCHVGVARSACAVWNVEDGCHHRCDHWTVLAGDCPHQVGTLRPGVQRGVRVDQSLEQVFSEWLA